MTPVTRFKPLGPALPGAAQTFDIYDSTQDGTYQIPDDKGAGKLQLAGLKWMVFSAFYTGAFDVNAYFSNDGGETWRLFYNSTQAAAPTVAGVDEFYIEPYKHVRVEIVNGAAAQTIWDFNLVASDHRSRALT